MNNCQISERYFICFAGETPRYLTHFSTKKDELSRAISRLPTTSSRTDLIATGIFFLFFPVGMVVFSCRTIREFLRERVWTAPFNYSKAIPQENRDKILQLLPEIGFCDNGSEIYAKVGKMYQSELDKFVDGQLREYLLYNFRGVPLYFNAPHPMIGEEHILPWRVKPFLNGFSGAFFSANDKPEAVVIYCPSDKQPWELEFKRIQELLAQGVSVLVFDAKSDLRKFSAQLDIAYHTVQELHTLLKNSKGQPLDPILSKDIYIWAQDLKGFAAEFVAKSEKQEEKWHGHLVHEFTTGSWKPTLSEACGDRVWFKIYDALSSKLGKNYFTTALAFVAYKTHQFICWLFGVHKPFTQSLFSVDKNQIVLAKEKDAFAPGQILTFNPLENIYAKVFSDLKVAEIKKISDLETAYASLEYRVKLTKPTDINWLLKYKNLYYQVFSLRGSSKESLLGPLRNIVNDLLKDSVPERWFYNWPSHLHFSSREERATVLSLLLLHAFLQELKKRKEISVEDLKIGISEYIQMKIKEKKLTNSLEELNFLYSKDFINNLAKPIIDRWFLEYNRKGWHELPRQLADELDSQFPKLDQKFVKATLNQLAHIFYENTKSCNERFDVCALYQTFGKDYKETLENDAFAQKIAEILSIILQVPKEECQKSISSYPLR